MSQVHPGMNCSADDCEQRDMRAPRSPPEPGNPVPVQTHRPPVCFVGNVKGRNPPEAAGVRWNGCV